MSTCSWTVLEHKKRMWELKWMSFYVFQEQYEYKIGQYNLLRTTVLRIVWEHSSKTLNDFQRTFLELPLN